MSDVKHPIIVSDKEWQDFITIQMTLNNDKYRLGLPCYNFVHDVYKMLNIDIPEQPELPPTTKEFVERAGNDWTRLDEPKPFCVALLKRKNADSYHVGIVTPKMELLQAFPKKGVVCRPLSKYEEYIVGYYWYTPGEGEPLPFVGGAIGKIIAGVILVIVGVVATAFLGAIGGSVWGPFLTKIGIGLIVGGVVEGIASLLISSDVATARNIEDKSYSSTNYGWDGITNNFRQGAVIGMLIGTVKVGGQIISERTWYDGENNEYLDTLICPCVGPISRFDDLRINDTEITAYQNCSVVYRPGDDEQTMIDMFDKIYLQYLAAAKLATTYTEFTSKTDITGMRISVSAPYGLYAIEKTTGCAYANSAVFYIQYKNTTTIPNWTNIPTGDSSYGTNNPFFQRLTGTFTGTANPFTLTDAGSYFTDQISSGKTFILSANSVVYYCTQTGTLTNDAFQFNAYTDAARTTPYSGSITSGAYYIYNENIHYSITGGTWRSAGGVTLATGFQTDINCKAIKFTVEGISTDYIWMRLNIWYRIVGGSWVKYNVLDLGLTYARNGSYVRATGPNATIGHVYRTFDIGGLVSNQYQVVVEWLNDDNKCGAPRNIENIKISNVYLDNSFTAGHFTLVGDGSNPLHLVTKTVELFNLTSDTYYFRLWRATADASTTSRQDSIYLRSYSEIIDKSLAYPNHALMGVRAMATDRLYGGRPTITVMATGAPLSVPASAAVTTVHLDEGLVTTPSTVINGVVVDGMRQIQIHTILTAQDDGEYYWLVRMDSSGYAQSDRLLTKWFCRVHTWETVGSYSRLYIENTEGIPADTSILLFSETSAPTDNLAWAVAKILIQGSRGKIPETKIDWASFALFDTWCESKGYKFNALLDYGDDLWTVAFKAAAVGRGFLVASGGVYKIVIDKASDPVQLFAEGNCNNVSIDFIPKSERANIIVTDYKNADKEYENDPISEEDVQGTENPWVTTLPLMVGVTNEDHIRDLLIFTLLQNRYIEKTIQFDAGIDSIETELGDVFLFASQAHDFCFSGRLRQLLNGTAVLDQTFTPEVAVTYKLSVWPTDEEPIYWTGTLTGTDIDTISDAFPGKTMEEYYAYPYILGKLSEDHTRYRCMGIRRIPDTMFATLTGIEYKDEVYAGD